MAAQKKKSWGDRIRDNGLSLVMFGLFLLSLVGHAINGHKAYNEELKDHGRPQVESMTDYLATGHFRGTLFENWESEFLQMALFVWLTVFLFQKGSSESKPPPEEDEETPKYPYMRYFRGQPVLRYVYEHSLCTTLTLMFLISMALHAQGSRDHMNVERELHGQPPLSFGQLLQENKFWFESFQNWQSEFFSVGMLVVLSIFLRQKDSAQSKEVDAPHTATGH